MKSGTIGRFFFFAVFWAGLMGTSRATSTARLWNEACLSAIRIDFPAPTVHARNLYHLSAGMYDAWAAYDLTAVGFFHHETASSLDVTSARAEAISYAAYRILSSRYTKAVNPGATQAIFNNLMQTLGYDTNVVTTVGDTPAAVGNRCAAVVLAYGASDGSNESQFYVDTTGYGPVNDPLILSLPGSLTLTAPNRWQPLAFDVAFTQNGLVADKIQRFVSPHWGYVKAFALSGDWDQGVYAEADPGAPPFLAGVGDAQFKSNIVQVLEFSRHLNADNGEVINISPAARGNNTLGTNDGSGYASNPVTLAPYADNFVKHGDYGRAVAEFWADGPTSETPPGHWNVLANQITEYPGFERRFQGTGPELDELEWDVKVYLALNGGLHDAAVAAWGVKARYDYVRPISMIRHMGTRGQSSDPGAVSYHPQGLPLVPGLIELITPASSATGERHAHLSSFVGEVAVYTWPGQPADPETQASGSGWIRAKTWIPYQRDTFVTPAFAGYVSGHSCFSRTAAEVLTACTGSPYFPGGLGTHTIPAGSFEFELGPSEDITLQWSKYYDAADEAGISRLYGGIHVAADDGPGRIMGSHIGQIAFQRALPYYSGAVLAGEFNLRMTPLPSGEWRLTWPCVADMRYVLEGGLSTESTIPLMTALAFPDGEGSLNHLPAPGVFFYKVTATEAP